MPARLLWVAAATALLWSGFACGASNSDQNAGVAYRWVDEKGVVHYGDRIPPQYAQKESSLLNRQGVEVRKLEAQKSPAELAEDERRRQESLRQKQRDSFLLTTYTSVKDIEQLRDARVTQIKGHRAAAEQYIVNLNERLVSLQTRAMIFRPYNTKSTARRMPDDLAEELLRTLNELRTQKNALATKEEEEATVRASFQADIDRYRELRGTHSAAAAAR